MKLYEIKEAYFQLLQSIENGDIAEEFINDTLESVEGDLEEKLDDIASFTKGILAEAIAIKLEISALQERVKSKEDKAEKLKSFIEKTMIECGLKKIETSRNILQIKMTPPSVYLDDNFIPWAKDNFPELLRYKEPEADKVLIKDLLKAEIKGLDMPAKLTQREKLNMK